MEERRGGKGGGGEGRGREELEKTEKMNWGEE